MVVLAGVLSNTASEVGYVLLVPLAGTLFLAVRRHPLAGLAAAFAGVSGGYSANLLLGTIDPLLAGLSQEAARLVDPTYTVNPACNYYFMVVSTALIADVGTLVTERLVEPRLGRYQGEEQPDTVEGLKAEERRGLWYAAAASIAFAGVLALGTVPSDGFLREPATGSLLHSPFVSGIVALIVAFFERWDRSAGIGTVIATMLPYTMSFLAGWMVLMSVWLLLGIPVGPGVPIEISVS